MLPGPAAGVRSVWAVDLAGFISLSHRYLKLSGNDTIAIFYLPTKNSLNYLAHAYLSFHRPGILVGNLISDYVKGKKKFDYPDQVQKGIQLHRDIDQFTDTHEATHQGKQVFRADYRLYAGAFMDVVYDHFLANDLNQFPADSLLAFTQDTYFELEQQSAILPESFARIFPYMKEHNWLYNYQFRWGIERSMTGLVRRSAYLSEAETAFRLFNEHYEQLQKSYDVFFPDLKKFVADRIITL